MKNNRIFKLLSLAAVVAGITSCSQPVSDKTYKDLDSYVKDVRKTVTVISRKEFNDILKKGGEFNLIDCRDAQSYSEACIKGAVNVPRGVLEFSETVQNRHIPTYVYSDKEDKSVLAARALRLIKYREVYVIAGSWDDWKTAYPDDVQLEPAGTAEEAPAAAEEEGGCGG